MGVSWIVVLSAVNFLYCANSLYLEEILQVDMHFRLLPETLHLAVNIIDCFSLRVSCLLPSYSWLALGACFLDHGTTCSQLPL